MAKRAKLKTALLKNKLFVALFVLLFAGIGAYAIINSHAAVPYVHVCVLYDTGSGDCIYTSNNSGNGIGVHIGPINGNTNGCVETYPAANGSVNYGITDTHGSVTFACGAGQYGLYADPPQHYTSSQPQITANNDTYQNVEIRLNAKPHGQAFIGAWVGTPTNHATGSIQGIYGQPAYLDWSSHDVANCHMGGMPGNPAIGTSGSNYSTGALTKTTGFYVNCTDDYGAVNSGTMTVNITAPNPSLPDGCGAGTKNNKCPTTTPPGGGTSSTGTKKTTSSPATVNDTIPPTAPTNLSAFQSGPGSVDLSWDASTDNIGVDHYVVERSTDGATWASINSDVTDVSYSDTDIDFNTQYFYRVYALDLAGNKSPASTTADITTQGFEANITAEQGATIKSDDGFVVAEIPDGAVSEDAFCEITKDSTRLTPAKLKLVAGAYQINCKNSAGDDITSFDKDASITMKLKTFKAYKNFKAYKVGDTRVSLINASFNKNDSTLHFKQADLEAFAAYGSKKGSSILFWLLLPFVLAGIIFAVLRYRNSRPDNTYYDTSGYVSMPPSTPVAPSGGYEHHASLPELVAQGQQPAAPQAHDPFAAPVPPQYQQPAPYTPQPQQPQDSNQPLPPQQQ